MEVMNTTTVTRKEEKHEDLEARSLGVGEAVTVPDFLILIDVALEVSLVLVCSEMVCYDDMGRMIQLC